jgi:hypothetical protein
MKIGKLIIFLQIKNAVLSLFRSFFLLVLFFEIHIVLAANHSIIKFSAFCGPSSETFFKGFIRCDEGVAPTAARNKHLTHCTVNLLGCAKVKQALSVWRITDNAAEISFFAEICNIASFNVYAAGNSCFLRVFRRKCYRRGVNVVPFGDKTGIVHFEGTGTLAFLFPNSAVDGVPPLCIKPARNARRNIQRCQCCFNQKSAGAAERIY